MKLSLNSKHGPFLKRIWCISRDRILQARRLLEANVYFGKYVDRIPDGSIVFFPCRQTMLCCGIAGIVAFKNKSKRHHNFNIESLEEAVRQMEASGYQSCRQTDSWNDCYLSGSEKIDALWGQVQALKTDDPFFSVFSDEKLQSRLKRLANHLKTIIQTETDLLAEQMGHLSAQRVDLISLRIEKLKDIAWSVDRDILSNTKKIQKFLVHSPEPPSPPSVSMFKKINAVLNSIDRLEVRGRDSANRPVCRINSRTAVSRTR